MPGEVYSSVKPAKPGRSWVVAILLLGAASGLAGDMVRRGAGTWTAGDLIQPEGWEIAFRPPAQFTEVDPEAAYFSAAYVYRHVSPSGRMVELSFWRLRAEEGSAGSVARFVLQKSKSWVSILMGPPPTRAAGRMGNRDALEVVDPAIPLVLRSVVLESGWGYAVSLRVEGAAIDESLYGLFEMTCRSVRFRGPSA